MRIKFSILLLFSTILWAIASGQGISNIWIMGYDCCTPPFSGMNLNFSSGSLVINPIQRYMNINCTNGEICDSNGNLLFYTNGIYIANSLDDTMQNGSGLNPSNFTTIRYNYGLSLPQANLIIPFPQDSVKYYLFHETSDDMNNSWSPFYFYYSIVDMSLNNGLGAVVQKNTILLHDSLVEGRITACKHANGRDWWVFAPRYMNGIMYEYLITPQGIQGPWQKNIVTHRDNWFGQALFSPQGNKFAYYEPYGDLDIWDFDRCTGDFTNQVHIDINDSAFAGGAAFSQSGRFLYISSTNYMYQFDMSANNIDSSRVIVGVYDGYTSYSLPTVFYLSALAPDGKIYTNSANSSTEIHVINYPDSSGLACDFCQHCVFLPGANAFTMPNHPNYFLGAEGGTLCDSLPTGVTEIRKPVDRYSIFPNPATEEVYMNLGNEDIVTVSVFNSLGQEMNVERSVIKNQYLHFDVSKLPSGFYIIELQTGSEKVIRRFVRK